MNRKGILPGADVADPGGFATERPADFFDIDNTFWKNLDGKTVLFFLFLVFFFLGFLIVASFWKDTPGLLAIAIIGLIAVGAICLALFANDKSIDELFRQHAGRTNTELVGTAFRSFWTLGEGSVAPFLRAAVTHRRTGITLRLSPSRQQSVIVPLSFQFEATPLNEALDSFVELEAAAPITVGEKSRTNRSNSPHDSIFRGFKRVATLGGGGTAVAVLIFMVLLNIAIFQFDPRWSPGALVLMFLLLRFSLSGIGSAWVSSRQWILVPGGVVVRRAPAAGTEWTPRLFRRSESALAVTCQTGDVWKVLVVGDGFEETARVTERECRMLLRAWLSPLPPPAPDRLIDLR